MKSRMILKGRTIWAYILIITMFANFLVGVPACAEEQTNIVYEEYSNIANGDFEKLFLGQLTDWDMRGASAGEGFYAEDGKRNVHSGKYSLKMATDSTQTPLYAAQYVDGAKGGSEYIVSFWLKANKRNQKGVAIKIEFQTEDGGSGYVQHSFNDTRLNRWEKQEFKFTLPKGNSGFYLLLRLFDGGEIYWDDLTITGLYDKAKDVTVPPEILPPAEPKELKAMAPDGKELFENPDFEDIDENKGGAKSWDAYKGWGSENQIVTVSKDQAYSGDNCIRIATNVGGNPWICQLVKDVEPETEYQLAIWVNTYSKAFAVKMEYYTDNIVSGDTKVEEDQATRLIHYASTNGQWQQFEVRFVTPANCKAMALYPRLYGNGEVFLDKATLYKTKQDKIKLDTDEVFYYTDREEKAVATVYANEEDYGDVLKNSVRFSIVDGETAIFESEVMPLQSKTVYKFPSELLAEKQKDYIFRATLLDENGAELERQEQILSRWDRPTRLTKDGKYIVDGKVINPKIAYYVEKEQYPLCKEMGINVVQFAMTANLGITLETLDAAHENGLMVLACMYSGMRPTGHPDNIENYTKILNAVKDHPAVFAYAMLDEPHMNYSPLDEILRKSYRLIREIDPERPVYLVESSTNSAKYAQTAKYCDIFGVDPYFESSEMLSTFVEDHIQQANEATNYNQPVISLFLTVGAEEGFYPKINEIRYESYRALMLGVLGTGLWRFAYSYTTKDGATKHLNESPLWEGWKAFEELEYKEAADAFLLGKYPIFNELKTEDYLVKSYVKDDKIRLILLNRSNTEKTVTIPLESCDGKIKIGAYTANVIAGGDVEAVEGTGTLTYDLKGNDALSFEITPADAPDFSGLTASRFVDLEGYSWARTQIDTLDQKGIINSKTYKSFAPGEKITRGDFALFLIRTLGLTSGSTENFSDVDPEAEYAKELATGKALGILNGIGDNKFAPEEEISRQDMMTIIARGMKLSGGADLSGYPDNEEIAEYALESVKAMIAAGLVKGNADGTINPTGHTTRAEAAVIMNRILER